MGYATTAIDAADWATAITHLSVAAAYLQSLPNGSQGGFSSAWDRSSIMPLIEHCKAMQAQAIAAASYPYTRIPMAEKPIDGDGVIYR